MAARQTGGLVAILAAAGVVACSSGSGGPGDAPATPPASDAPAKAHTFELADAPIDGVGPALEARFNDGDGLFDLPFRDADGLGPLYIRVSCAACHDKAARGPGLVQKMARTSGANDALPYGSTVRPLTAGGGKTPILPPADGVRVSVRVGPPILGRGYMEAVRDDEIERVAAEQVGRADGIHGRVHRVVFASEPNPEAGIFAHANGEANVIGRFGLKARIATLDEFTADAFQGDMGLTTPMRTKELPNPDGLEDDAKPGVDIDLDIVNKVADYMRLLAIPARRLAPEAKARGQAAFDKALCSACHVPSLRTRKDHPVPALRDVDAPVYTDFLLHDMGDDLADGVRDGEAGPRDWRTAPLIGLRFSRSYLHDGRATTLEQAIVGHDGPGSEAHGSVEIFRNLTSEERAALLDFVGSL